MGQKRTRARKLLLFYFTCMFSMILLITGCVPFNYIIKKQQAWIYLNRAEHLMEKGDYDQALKLNKQALKVSKNVSPGDQALYNMGKICILTQENEEGYQNSLGYFKRLVRDFPQSDLKKEATIWIRLLSVLIDKQRTLKELERNLQINQEENKDLKKLSKKHKSRLKELEAQLKRKDNIIEDLRLQLKKIKEIDLELNRKKEKTNLYKGKDLNGTGEASGS